MFHFKSAKRQRKDESAEFDVLEIIKIALFSLHILIHQNIFFYIMYRNSKYTIIISNGSFSSNTTVKREGRD